MWRIFIVSHTSRRSIRLPTTTIVETGPYRLTRNPIYLGMVLGLIGLAIAFNSLWQRAGGRRRRRRRLRQHGGAGNRRRAGRRHDRLAGGLAVVQDAMTMLEIPSDESGGAPGRLLHARGT